MLLFSKSKIVVMFLTKPKEFEENQCSERLTLLS